MNKFQKLIYSVLIPALSLGLSMSAKGQPLPVDPAMRIGKLGNGMTYYIRHNEEPKDRASFYIIQNVGALLENDNQNGLAHFLEHMAFNGTQHFPGKGIISTLEKHGVAFGRNINAYTAYTETVYNLSDVPVTHAGLVDTCLLVLNDWSHYLLLTDEEIDAERGVIAEEWRTRRDANFRMREKYFPVLLKDSKYAVRDIIGDLNVIKTFDYNTLRSFYHDWYRTDLQAIAIVGDINVDEVEAKIKALFSAIPAVENAKARAKFEVPNHKETRFVLATDPEASQSMISLYIKHDGRPNDKKDISYYREELIANLYNMMINDRIAELLQKGEPPFINGDISFGGFVRDYDVLGISATANPNREAEALKAIYTEAQRIYRHGFTPTEVERAKSNLLTQLETKWKQKDKIRNDEYIDNIVEHFLTNEPLTSLDFDWEATQALLPSVETQEISAKAKEWMKPENRVIIIMGPEQEGIKHLNEEESLAILGEVEKSDIKPYEDAVTSSSLIEGELKGSPIVKSRKLEDFDAVEWTLGNNARVVYRKADYEKDNIQLLGLSLGGSSIYPENKVASAMMVPQFMEMFGVGDFDAVTLKKMLTGKNVSLGSSISDLNESFNGTSTPKDFETLLQLLYLQFEKPRFDEEAYQALKSRYQAYLANMANNPQKVMSDSLQLIMTNYSKRTKLMVPEMFNEVSLKQMEEIYRDRIADAGDFTFFIVGNIDEASVKPLVEKYIGSLTDLPRTENWKDNKVGVPEGKTNREIAIPLETEKATVVISFNNQSGYNPKNNLLTDVLKGILRLRYTEEIREKEGGTYGVSVSSSNKHFPREEKEVEMQFDTDPAKAEHLKSIVYSEIDKIIANGPTAEDLDKTVKNLLKEREQAKLHNSYWMSTLSGYYMHNINNDAAENFEKILQAMTRTDVQQFAKEFFKTADVVDVVFKPKAKE